MASKVTEPPTKVARTDCQAEYVRIPPPPSVARREAKFMHFSAVWFDYDKNTVHIYDPSEPPACIPLRMMLSRQRPFGY